MTTKKKTTASQAIEINLDTLIDTLLAHKEQYDIKDLEIETLQAEQEALQETIKEEVVQLNVIKTFSSAEQQERIEALDLQNFIVVKPQRIKTRGRGNQTCSIVLNILENADGELTNEQLHHAYLDAMEDETGLNYTQFNIALRPLTNDNKFVTRTFVEDGNSRTALMSLTTKES